MQGVNDKLASIERKQDVIISVQAARSSLCAERGVEITTLKTDQKEKSDDSVRQWAAIDSLKKTIYMAMGGIGMLSATIQIFIAIWTKHQWKP
jgi:hypothetical protein